MNTRRTSRRVGEADSRENQTPPQAPAAGVKVPVNPAALTDGEVIAALVLMNQAITSQAQTTPHRPLKRVLPRRTHMLAPWLAD